MMLSDTKSEEQIDAPFASSALHASLGLLSDLVDMWGQELPAAKEVFSHAQRLLPLLLDRCGEKMHPTIASAARKLLKKIEGQIAGKKAITVERKKPKILRQYEPEFDDRLQQYRIFLDIMG